VRHILAGRGPCVAVIVIDDGSSDATSAIVARAFAIDPRVTLLTIPNAGKAWALDRGLGIAKGDVVVALDADTQFELDTIARSTCWFADPRIGAVAGNARIGNAVNLVTRWQAVEYRQLLYAVVVFSGLAGPRVGWGKLERSGHVMVEGRVPGDEPVETVPDAARSALAA
jgi:cellulose synthase/poly-beta-1,6-N-acetylglucosamine synthase-like glycosyltransferase